MTANSQATEWGNEHTVTLPTYRTLSLGCADTGPLIHVTPKGYHIVDLECDGVCLVCNHILQGDNNVR